MDRNSTYVIRLPRVQVSLSARRAWIEICPTCQWRRSVKVALRKESVDRNNGRLRAVYNAEINVALRKESVDRNILSAFDVLAVSASLSARRAWIEIFPAMAPCEAPTSRSPQGERG